MTDSIIWQMLDRIQSLAVAAKLTGHGCSAVDAILSEVLGIKGLLADMPGTMLLADFLSLKHVPRFPHGDPDEKSDENAMPMPIHGVQTPLFDLDREIKERR
jgi:hypothetical protein